MKNQDFDAGRLPALNGVLTNAPIGVFDSGVGGLTVLRELYRQLPNESILYFGDTARLPYGTRSQAEILQFVREILTWMVDRQVKMVIMACNTSSALAIEAVRAEFPGLPILGVILPGARAAVQTGKRIGVISTPATAASDAYRQAILEVDAPAEVAQSYLQPLLEAEIDTLVYGCTHYPHLAPVLKTIVPRSVQLLDPAVHVVKAAAQELDLLGLRHNRPPVPTQFYVSGDPVPFVELSRQWLGCTPIVERVELPELVNSSVVI